MNAFPFLSTAQWLVVLRVTLALLLAAHGVMRASVGTVDDFGVFLDSRGFPFGLGLAWAITVYEVVGGGLLAAGRWVRPICAGFVLHQVMGIALVHAPRGWFVVGHQVGGAEYSVLLVCAFLVVASTARPVSRTT